MRWVSFIYVNKPYFKMKTLNNPHFPSLLACVIFDAISCIGLFMSQYQTLFKIIWAPLSALIYFRLYGGKIGFFGGAGCFVEESSDYGFTIPMFTITWFAKARVISKNAQASLNHQ